MPSYRMHLPIGDMRPGITPAEVMEQAELALGTLHVVEKRDVEAPLVGGKRIGRVVLRFTVDSSTWADEDATARQALRVVIDHLEGTTATIAPPFAVLLTRGMGGRFRPIPPG
ncbi:hypothetical protein [Brachybacterium sp. p3-SID957]|uniref:hypothetical protein n=1 Tax=Brachybacterium sp. p3-SID957 TaxID=2916049 RepID=UPI00223C4FA1|nr:hypothetical protein [Brachybacterium sp. p3-SID957]MCT1776210.1 hypothetical protein [Brachybacterium sp. p3-SID957]